MHKALFETFAKYEKIVFVGGGTGGHISPIVSLASELRDKELIWIGRKDSQEEATAKKEWIPFFSISILKLTTTHSPKILLYPYVLLRWIREARKVLRSGQQKNKNLCVFSKWWPGSVAVGIAAWSMGIPLYIHESDTIPGRSNTLLGRFATRVFLGFKSAEKYFDTKKCEVIGQILDPILEEWRVKSKEWTIHWKTDKKHILVFCGSQWARAVFEEIIRTCHSLDVEWIVVLGKLNTGMRTDFEKLNNIQILDWLDKKDQRALFEWTDIAITRGSATTLAELDLFGIKKIIIPLPSAARNHQYYNALEYEKKWDIVLEQKNIVQLKEILHSFL